MKNFMRLFLILSFVFLASCGNVQNQNPEIKAEKTTESVENSKNNFEKNYTFEIEKNYPITTEVEKISENSLENPENTIVVKPKVQSGETIFVPTYIGVNDFSWDISAPLSVHLNTWVVEKSKTTLAMDIFSPNSVSGALLLGSSTGESSLSEAIDKKENAHNTNNFRSTFVVDGEKMEYPKNSLYLSTNADVNHEKYIEKIVVDLSEIREKFAKMEKMDTPEYLTIATGVGMWNKAVPSHWTEEDVEFFAKWNEVYDANHPDVEKFHKLSDELQEILSKNGFSYNNMTKYFYTTTDGKRHEIVFQGGETPHYEATSDEKFELEYHYGNRLTIQDFELLKNIVKIEFEFPPLPSELKLSPKYKEFFGVRRPNHANADYRDERFGIFGYKEQNVIFPKNAPEHDAIIFAFTADKIDENGKIDNLDININKWFDGDYRYKTDYWTASGGLLVNTFIASPEWEGKNSVKTEHSIVYPNMENHPMGLFRSEFYGVQEPSLMIKNIFKKSGDWMYSQVKMANSSSWREYWSDEISLDVQKVKNVKKFVLDFSAIKDIVSHEPWNPSEYYSGFQSQFTMKIGNFSENNHPKVGFFAVKSSGEKVEISFIDFKDGEKYEGEAKILGEKFYNEEWKLESVSIGASDKSALSEYEKFEIIFE